ncbi:MAG: lysozyme inhibitor LprI family protein [Marinobacter sp.]
MNGTYNTGDLETAKTFETFLPCPRDNIYCSDPLIQDYKQILLEAAAAAISRMPDVEGRRDVAPGSISLFHQSLLRCNREAVRECSRRAGSVQEKYDLLSNFPAESISGDACEPNVEKACNIALLTDRIDAWNKRNTQADTKPVLALHDPGFNCLRRQSAAMNTVCRDAELSALHRDMLAHLNSLPEKIDRDELPRDQAKILTDSYWHTATYGCHDNKECLRSKIEQRIADINEISGTMELVAAEMTERELELEAQRRLEDIRARRAQLSGRMEAILNDATMPVMGASRQHENIRAHQRATKIAAIEKELSELAGREGRVYRGLWFWSQFRDPRSMRKVFRGNRTVSFTAEEGAIYFHNGYPLERGHSDQIGVLTAWVRVYSSSCRHLLPESPDKLSIRTFTTSGPIINRTTRLSYSDVLEFQNGLIRPYLASREEFQKRQREAFQGGNAFAIMLGGSNSVSSLARSQVGPYIYALDDFTKFLNAVGCDSPTARQMSQGISLVAHGKSLPEETTEAGIPGAEWVSDAPQEAGDVRLHSEICWNYDLADHNTCGCLLDIAKARLGEKETLVTNADYRRIHEAFMQAPADDQKLCRDPLGAISAGLM